MNCCPTGCHRRTHRRSPDFGHSQPTSAPLGPHQTRRERSRAPTHDVQHNAHVIKALPDVARVRVAAVAEQGLWRAPCARVGLLVHDVLGDLVPGEVPDLDGVAGPVHGVHTAPDGADLVSVRENCWAQLGLPVSHLLEVIAVRGRVARRRGVVAALDEPDVLLRERPWVSFGLREVLQVIPALGLLLTSVVQFVYCCVPVKSPVLGRVQTSPLHETITTSEKMPTGRGLGDGDLRVCRYDVAVCHIGTLYYVDFSSIRPVWAVQPNCGSTMCQPAAPQPSHRPSRVLKLTRWPCPAD